MNQQYSVKGRRHFRLTMAFQMGSTLQSQEALWDDLNDWCLQRGVFLGGTYDNAFLLVTRKPSRLDGRLTSWLRSKAVLVRWEIEVTALETVSVQKSATDQGQAPRSFHTPADHNARLEAITQFQQYLGEQLQGTVLALHTLRRAPNSLTVTEH